MKGTRRGTLTAMIGYALVVAIVLASMGWATSTALRLDEMNLQADAKKQRERFVGEHEQNIKLAMWKMDSVLLPILSRETGRDYTDYASAHHPSGIYSSEGDPVDPRTLVKPSPLLKGPQHEWIDLYFQVDPGGVWSSPQVPNDDDAARNPAAILVSGVRVGDIQAELEYLASTLTRMNWPLCFTRSCLYCDGRCTCDRHLNAIATGRGAVRSAKGGPLVKAGTPSEYIKRGASQIRAQRSALPPELCVPVDLVVGALAGRLGSSTFSPTDASYASVVYSEMRPFWIRPLDLGNEKLAFVRTVTVDGTTYHQGFRARWRDLKPLLLAQIKDLFPEADLSPVSVPAGEDPDDLETLMQTIPARLVVSAPEPVVTLATGWRPVHTTLSITWAVTLAMLLAAGLGLSNLVALSRRRMQFAYAVTHELRTPLTTFRLYTDMLSAGLVPDDAKQEYLDTLNVESERLTSLVEGVLEYARLENHKVRLNSVETTGADILDRLSLTLAARCKATGVSAKTQNDVPDDVRLETDVDVLNRIAGVLVNNACRHAAGSDRPEVYVQLAADNGYVRLDVIDSGPGVDRRDERRVFKPFRRGRRADANAQGGIGLGLALARSWAKLLGGRLDLVDRKHSRLGGAHFRLTVPSRAPRA